MIPAVEERTDRRPHRGQDYAFIAGMVSERDSSPDALGTAGAWNDNVMVVGKMKPLRYESGCRPAVNSTGSSPKCAQYWVATRLPMLTHIHGKARRRPSMT